MASNNATEKGFQRAQKIDELRKKIGQTTESTELQKLHQQVAEVQFPDEFSSENEDPLQIQDKNEDMRNDDLPVIQSIPLLTSHSNGPTLSLFDPSAEECSSITSGEEFVRQTAKTRHRSGSSNSSASSLSAFGQKQPNQGRRRSITPNKLADPIRLTPDAKKRVMSYNYRGPLPSNHHCQRSLFGRTFEVTPPETPKRSKSSIGIIQKKTVPRSRSHSREKFAVTEVAKKGLTLHQLSCSADRHAHSHTQARAAAERSKSPVSRLSGNPTRNLKKFHQSNQGQNSLWQPFGRAKSMSMDGLSPGKLHENAFQVAQDEDGYAIPSTLNSSNSATPMAEEKTPHYSPFRKETSETPKHLYRTPMSEFRSGPLSDEEKFYTPSVNFNRRPSMDVLEHEADSPVIKEIIRQKDERIARIDAALEKCMSPNERILADFDEQINVNPCSYFREAPEVFEKNRQEAIESAVLLHQIASPRRPPQDPLQRWEDKREKIQSGHTLWNVETWQEIDFGSTEGADNFGDMQRQSEAQGETKKTDLQAFQRRTKVADAQTETDTAFGETKKTTQTTDAKKNTDFVPSRGDSDFGKIAKTTDKKSWNQFFVGHMRKEADFGHANVLEARKGKHDKNIHQTGKDRSGKDLLFNFEKEPVGKKERKSGVANVKAQNEVPVSKFPQFMGTSLTPEKLKEIYCNSLDLFLTAKRKLIKFEKLKADKLEDGRRLDEIERMLQDLEARREVAKLKVDNVLKDYNEVNGFYILGEIQKLQKATQSFVAILKDIKAGKRKTSGVFDRINVKAFENNCLQHYNNRLEKAQKLNESIKRIDFEKSKAEKMEAKVVRKLVQMVTHNKSTEAVNHGSFSTETEVLESESISSSKITYIKQFMAADYEKTKQLVSSRREKSDSISLSAAIPRMSLPASVLKSKFSSSSSALSTFNKSLDISGNANQEPFPLISARHHVERISEYMSKNPEPVRPQQEVVDEMNLFPFNPPPQLVPRLDFSSFREEQEADIDVSADHVQVNEAAAGDVADDLKNKYRIEPLEEDSFVIESKSKDQEEVDDKLDSAGRTSRDVSSIDEVELDPVFEGRCQEENDEQVIDLTDRMEKISLLKESEKTERTQTPESDQVVSQKQVEEVVLNAKSSSESDSVFSALPSSSLSASQLQSLQEVASTASEEKEESPVAVVQVEDVNEGAAKSSSESSVSAEVAAQDFQEVVSEPVIGKKDEDLTSVGEVTSEAESVPEMLVDTGRDDTIASDLPSLRSIVEMEVHLKDKDKLESELCDSRAALERVKSENAELEAKLEEARTMEQDAQRSVLEMEVHLKDKHETELIDSRAALEELKAENAELEAKLEEASREEDKLEEELSDSRAALERVKSENAELEAKLEEARTMEQDAQRSVLEMEVHLKDKDKHETELIDSRAALEELKAENAELEAKLEEASREEGKLEEELSDSRTALEELKAENAQLEAKLEDARTTEQGAQRAVVEMEMLLKDKDKLESELSDSRTALERVKADNAELEAKLEEARTMEQDAQRSVLEMEVHLKDKHEAELSDSRIALKGLKSENAVLEAQLEEALRDEGKLEEELNDSLAALEELKAENAQLEAKLEEAMKDVYKLEAELSDSRTALERVKSENAKLEAKLEEASREEDKLEEELSDSRAALERVKSENAELEAKLEEARTMEQDAQRSVLEMEVHLKDKDKHETELIDSRAALEELKAENAELEAKLEDARTTEQGAQRAVVEMEMLLKDKDKLLAELNDSRTALERVKAENAVLEAILEEAVRDEGKLEAELSGSRAALGGLKAENTELEAKLEEVRTMEQGAQRSVLEMEMLLKDKDKLEEELSDFRAALELVKSENAELEAKLDEAVKLPVPADDLVHIGKRWSPWLCYLLFLIIFALVFTVFIKVSVMDNSHSLSVFDFVFDKTVVYLRDPCT